MAWLGSAWDLPGRLALRLGRRAEAARHLADAAVNHAAMAAAPFVARTELARARLALADGDLDAARSIAGQASARAAELGMAGLVARSAVLLDRAGSSDP